MIADAPVCILLATYHGERFLAAQLDSIARQDDPNWRLIARDDGSDDGTVAMLRDAASADARIAVIDAPTGRLGFAGNFFALMQAALEQGAQYFALCDQDDVWHADKLCSLRRALATLEAAETTALPMLAWSDLEWIDERGRGAAGSHFRRAGLPQALAGGGLWLLAMNAVPGCAMLGNRALLELALPRPPGVLHHDWWLALLAAAYGRTTVIDRPLVEYRQHAANAIGAASPSMRGRAFLGSPALLLSRARATYWQAVANAAALRGRADRERLDPLWSEAANHVVEALGAHSRWRRAHAVVRGPVRRIGAARNALMLWASLASLAGESPQD